MPGPAPEFSPAEALCTCCGLCCDGTLFAEAPLLTAEVEEAQRVGLRVLARPDGRHAFRQPCAALSDCTCRIYAERPRVCRTFHCALLSALSADEVGLDEARALVDRVKAVAARLTAAIGDASAREESDVPLKLRVMNRFGPRGAAAMPPEVAQDLEKLDGLLRLYFRWQRDS